ncbi:metallophosphoesterase [Nocardioides marinisabuli]|uniref:metallophosphoesterase n=1 Tax=Nocardioides marinisabuli TaxID=419476 RepID=UPI001C60D182|nr:metallophosphoesterase [Nocardioides marinisabuli]
MRRSTLSRAVIGTLITLLATGTGGAVAASGSPQPSAPTASEPSAVEAPRLFVSEINGDNAGTGYFEYVELHNPGDEAVDLDAEGIELSYSLSDDDRGGSAPPSSDKALTRGGEGSTIPLPEVETVLPAHGTLVLWFQNSGPAYLAKTDDDFRTHYGLDDDVPLVHLTGQDGFANGGGRSIRVLDGGGTELTRSYVPPRSASVADGAVHFRLPATTGTSAPVWYDGATEPTTMLSPGTVDPEQLAPAPTTPEPTAEPTAEPTQEPTGSSTPSPTTGPSSTPTTTVEPEPTQGGDPTGAPGATRPSAQDLFISEIHPDNGDPANIDDDYEFFEVTNTTDADIDLGRAGIGVSYATTSSPSDTAMADALDLALSDGDPTTPAVPGPLDVVVPAGSSTVFWLDYASGKVDTYARSEADFRGFYGDVPADTDVVRVEGQAGIANGGLRGLGLVDASSPDALSVVSWSYLPGRSPTTPAISTHFRVPPVPSPGSTAGDRHAAVPLADGAPTPGTTTAAQLDADPTTDPTTGPTEGPTETPTETPGGPGVPEQGPPPATDPALDAPLLQVTEVAPDTTNVGSADGYEFIEVYNASDRPVSFADYVVNYLYTDANEVTLNATLWPARPADPVIAPGRTLVLWIKNSQNDALGAADFNAHFGARLTAGVDLVEIHSPGLANGGLRGIQVRTNTGHDVSRAYYHDDADTVSDQPLQYAWGSGTVQTKRGTGTATPGYAAPEQVPAGLVATPDDTTAPRITDLTGSDDAPATDGLALELEVGDDRLVRTVELTLETDQDTASSRYLEFGAPDRYSYEVPAVDLYGKRWVEYSVRTSDGTNTSSLGPVRVQLSPDDQAPLRLNVQDGQYVGATTRLSATASGDTQDTGGTEDLGIAVDGTRVSPTVPTLEAEPLFAFEATSTDAFFRNGVRIGEEVLTIFDEGFYDRVETVSTPVPLRHLTRGEDVTVGIYAGTKAWPRPDLDENNDDFSAMNLRLALPDGRVLRPVRCAGAGEGQEETARACPQPTDRVGFTDASQVYFTATFEVPDDAFDSVAHDWDTTTVTDGAHRVSAILGSDPVRDSVEREVLVDNTAPEVESSIADGSSPRGPFTLDASATDAGAGLPQGGLSATLDGVAVTLPHETSSLELAAGEHTLVLSARDRVGNQTARTITFTTVDEQPSTALVSPDHQSTVPAGDVPLAALVDSAAGDDLTVRFREGHTFTAADAQVEAFGGATGTALATDRPERVALDEQERAEIAGTDGVTHEVSSADALPYQLFTVAVPADAGSDARARLSWTGSANAGAKVLMHVQRAGSGRWQEVARRVTDDAGTFTLEALVPAAEHAVDGEITVLVQHSEGFAGRVQSTREDTPTPYHPGATPRSEYDFTIGWESDTQYYNETQDWNKHQLAINEFLVDQREELDLQYVIHTGDIVNVASEPRQWQNADPAYRLFDEAGLPYGVLAGNHDVGQHDNDYSAFSRWFGEARFAGNPWYGGSHQDNRGHYDLISAGGIDFLMLYMGWAPGDAQLEWMNQVIADHPERKVWINVHEFMLTTGGLGPMPQRIMDEVVAPNPNVFAVSSGHYHDAYTRTDDFDDDGDGEADRTVYSMLFDYQGLAEGGLGYLRLMHFDNQGGRVLVRTYSPSLRDHDSDDPSLDQVHQEFEIPYAAVGISPAVKTLATDSFRADVLTSRDIEVQRDVASGSTARATWRGVPEGEHGWYVETTGPFEGRDLSEVRTFTALAAQGPAEFTEAPTPVLSGTARVGETLTADAGTWAPADPEVRLTYRWSADGEPVAGADAASLALGPDLVGAVVTVTATGAQAGYATTSRTSAPSAPVAEGELVAPVPSVSGEPVVGATLTAVPGAWTPGTRLTYQWAADGEPVAGADGATLEVADGLVGRRLSVAVTGTLEGYASRTRTSASTAPVSRPDVEAGTPRLVGTARWW